MEAFARKRSAIVSESSHVAEGVQIHDASLTAPSRFWSTGIVFTRFTWLNILAFLPLTPAQ